MKIKNCVLWHINMALEEGVWDSGFRFQMVGIQDSDYVFQGTINEVRSNIIIVNPHDNIIY